MDWSQKTNTKEGTIGPFQPEGTTHATCHEETIRDHKQSIEGYTMEHLYRSYPLLYGLKLLGCAGLFPKSITVKLKVVSKIVKLLSKSE